MLNTCHPPSHWLRARSLPAHEAKHQRRNDQLVRWSLRVRDADEAPEPSQRVTSHRSPGGRPHPAHRGPPSTYLAAWSRPTSDCHETASPKPDPEACAGRPSSYFRRPPMIIAGGERRRGRPTADWPKRFWRRPPPRSPARAVRRRGASAVGRRIGRCARAECLPPVAKRALLAAPARRTPIGEARFRGIPLSLRHLPRPTGQNARRPSLLGHSAPQSPRSRALRAGSPGPPRTAAARLRQCREESAKGFGPPTPEINALCAPALPPTAAHRGQFAVTYFGA